MDLALGSEPKRLTPQRGYEQGGQPKFNASGRLERGACLDAPAYDGRACRNPGPLKNPEVGGGGGAGSTGATFFGRASRVFRINSSFAFWNFDVPGATPV